MGCFCLFQLVHSASCHLPHEKSPIQTQGATGNGLASGPVSCHRHPTSPWPFVSLRATRRSGKVLVKRSWKKIRGSWGDWGRLMGWSSHVPMVVTQNNGGICPMPETVRVLRAWFIPSFFGIGFICDGICHTLPILEFSLETCYCWKWFPQVDANFKSISPQELQQGTAGQLATTCNFDPWKVWRLKRFLIPAFGFRFVMFVRACYFFGVSRFDWTYSQCSILIFGGVVIMWSVFFGGLFGQRSHHFIKTHHPPTNSLTLRVAIFEKESSNPLWMAGSSCYFGGWWRRGGVGGGQARLLRVGRLGYCGRKGGMVVTYFH